MRRLLALPLAALLLLTACDSSNDYSDDALQDEPVFEMTLAPGTPQARTVTGSTVAPDELEGQFATFFDLREFEGFGTTIVQLTSADSTEHVIFLALSDGPLQPQRYAFFEQDVIGGDGDSFELQEGFTALYFVKGSEDDLPQVGFSKGGAVELMEATGALLRGSFATDFRIIGQDELLGAEGVFTATLFEQNRSE
jgi:hypothetical protein